MRNSALLAAILAGMLIPAAALGQDDDLIGKLFDKVGEVYGQNGFTANGWEHRGTLKEGGTEDLQVALSGGAQYQVIGVCDGDCSNFDIHLLDASGTEVDADDQEDDFPIVGTKTSGSFTAHLVMTACGSATCNYGVKVYRK